MVGRLVTRSSMKDKIDVTNQTGLYDAVLKYISRVLMEDDDFEDEANIINDSKLIATKRSFYEVILGHEESDDMARERNMKNLAEEDQFFISEMFSEMGIMFGKNSESLLTTQDVALPNLMFRKREDFDLTNRLLECMQSVALSDHDNVNKLLKEIKSRADDNGDGTQRVAHYFAEGLEARLTSTRVNNHKILAVRTISDNDILKAFKLYLTALPFTETSYFFANQTIMGLAKEATSLHIIDFGILYGLQWGPFIQKLSGIPGGPPKLRITAIDFPQTGIRPDARVKDTGRRLESYCAEYSVLFEYESVTKNWEEVELEDIRMEKDETLVVNSMHQFMYLHDEAGAECSPRDKVLNLIKRINPKIFVHVIVNASYDSPFFASRFREAMLQYSTWFDLFDVNLPRESQERLVFEKEVLRKQIVNIVASEGLERAERPETYRQWHTRTIRAGFEPISLNSRIVKKIQTRVKTCYHKEFFVEEDGPWLIDGWKGKPLFGASCWKLVI